MEGVNYLLETLAALQALEVVAHQVAPVLWLVASVLKGKEALVAVKNLGFDFLLAGVALSQDRRHHHDVNVERKREREWVTRR